MGTVTPTDPHPSFLADKDAKVFVSGHRGLVGSAILRRLLSLGFTNVVVRTHAELDLTRQSDVEAFFAVELPRYVVLAAAKVGGIHANSTYPADFISANLQIQTNVVDAALKCRSVRKLLFLGSSCIYPKFAPQPIPENSLLSGPLEPTNEWYAVAKIAGIKMCQAYRIQHGLDAISAMPTNLYGPNDNFHPDNSHVLPALIRRFHEARVSNAPEVVVWGSGSPLREFLHVDDLADAVVFLMDQYSGLEHVNVGSGSEVTIKELAELVKGVVGFQGKLVWDSSKPDGTPRKLMDSSKIQGMGWKPKVPLKEGLVETYKCINNGQLKLEDTVLTKSILENSKCFLLDCGAELFVWVGRVTQVEERKSASAAVEEFIVNQNRPKTTRITRVIQGYENHTFKSNFESWPVSNAAGNASVPEIVANIKTYTKHHSGAHRTFLRKTSHSWSWS